MDNLIILFVIGGITCNEVKEIRDVVSKTGGSIIIGSTNIASPDRAYDALFKTYMSDPI